MFPTVFNVWFSTSWRNQPFHPLLSRPSETDWHASYIGFVRSAAACRELSGLRTPEDFTQITHWGKQELILLKPEKTVKGLLFFKMKDLCSCFFPQSCYLACLPVVLRLGAAQEVSWKPTPFTSTKSSTNTDRLTDSPWPGVLCWKHLGPKQGFKHINTGLWRFGKKWPFVVSSR